MFWPCSSLFSFKALLYFRHLCYFFMRSCFQGAFSFHSALFLSGRFYFIHGAFILFRALYFSCIAPFWSCIALYSDSCVSQHLYICSNCESAALFHFPSKLSCSYYFNFLVWSTYLLISEWDFWWLCVSISILILYKTFRFWPLIHPDDDDANAIKKLHTPHLYSHNLHCGVESSRVTVRCSYRPFRWGKANRRQQGQLSGCGGVIRSHFGLLFLRLAAQRHSNFSFPFLDLPKRMFNPWTN